MRTLFAGLLAGLLFAPAGHGADLAVLPVGLSLAAGHDRAAITITNQGSETVAMQVETVSWTQSGSEDHYSPTRDLLVNPPLFRLPPGSSQVLRVGLRRSPAGEREAAYRLFLREVPTPAPAGDADSGGAHIRVLLELRLPVYVTPAKIVSNQQWHGRRSADGGIAVEVANTGNVHLVVSELKLRPAGAAPDAPPFATAKAGASIFPGQSRAWSMRPPAGETASRYALEVTTDRGTQNVVLDLDRE